MDPPTRGQISPGDTVSVETKDNQGTGRLTKGVVADILTKSESHPHGIKVRLKDGQVGRVKVCGIHAEHPGTPSDLDSLEIPGSEDVYNEFKKYYQYDDRMEDVNPGPDKSKAIDNLKHKAQGRIAEAVAGFANSESGGVLFIGVDDKGTVCGLEKDLELGGFSGYADAFANHLNTRLIEHLRDKIFISRKLRMKFREIGGKTVCVIAISPADKPVYLYADGQEIFPVRGPAPRVQRLGVREQVEYIRKRFPGA